MLGFLGFKRKYTFGKTAGWSNGKTLYWIGEADAEGKKHKHRIGNIGFHHYAFELGKRRDVDDLYEVPRSAHKVERSSIRPPTIPTTARATTPCSSSDPDGLKLEGMVLQAAAEEAQDARKLRT